MRRYDPAHVAAKKQIDAGEIGEPVIFKSIGRDKDMPPIGAYESRINGMLFYTCTIHDFDSARWSQTMKSPKSIPSLRSPSGLNLRNLMTWWPAR